MHREQTGRYGRHSGSAVSVSVSRFHGALHITYQRHNQRGTRTRNLTTVLRRSPSWPLMAAASSPRRTGESLAPPDCGGGRLGDVGWLSSTSRRSVPVNDWYDFASGAAPGLLLTPTSRRNCGSLFRRGLDLSRGAD